MSLHLLRMRRNVNRNVYDDRKNVSTTSYRVVNRYDESVDAACLKPTGDVPISDRHKLSVCEVTYPGLIMR